MTIGRLESHIAAGSAIIGWLALNIQWKALNIQCYTHVGVQNQIKSIVYHPTQELTNLQKHILNSTYLYISVC